MILNFLGNCPQQKYFRLGVTANNLVDNIVFIIDRKHGDIDLTEFTPFLKIQNKDLSFSDKTKDLTVETLEDAENSDKLKITYVVPDTVTRQKTVDMQLSFEKITAGGKNTLIWQTQIFNMTPDKSIDVSGVISNTYPDVIKDLNERMWRVENSAAAILQYPDKLHFPNIGQGNTIYVDAANNKAYRFDIDDNTYYVIGSNYEDIKIINANGGETDGKQDS